MKETQGLWMDLLNKKEELKCVLMVFGEVFAVLAGTPLMPMLYAGSLASLDLVSNFPISKQCFT